MIKPYTIIRFLKLGCLPIPCIYTLNHESSYSTSVSYSSPHLYPPFIVFITYFDLIAFSSQELKYF